MFMGGVRLPLFSFYTIKWGSQTSVWYCKEGIDIVCCLEAKPSGAYFNMLDTPIVFRASHVVHSAHALPDTSAGFQRVTVLLQSKESFGYIDVVTRQKDCLCDPSLCMSTMHGQG